ncbi:hypothetical protein ACVIW2_006276 [Bradyrhizobium huanghuaihaiense]|jgi:hypothetical protein|uniref:Uncharacterized protein n=5 Tax=Bradyrhizobium TaxID=374 RepID=A0A8I1Y1E3_BRAEL|nr:hypothetical protein [Bradyrhizobium japonicum]MBP1291748.1 hypothetical protein [Bradyrhizobium elkanii]MCS3890940.1 hypothetical protein [Bradyrhizobium japonicum USDA 38]TWH90557.1 hypothetical protein IQ17_07463 [Bradyrhizobium daqingense]TWI54140.1 hypothetical protein IQ16_08684 [Bradyrhizobium huanghuaihaiense]
MARATASRLCCISLALPFGRARKPNKLGRSCLDGRTPAILGRQTARAMFDAERVFVRSLSLLSIRLAAAMCTPRQHTPECCPARTCRRPEFDASECQRAIEAITPSGSKESEFGGGARPDLNDEKSMGPRDDAVPRPRHRNLVKRQFKYKIPQPVFFQVEHRVPTLANPDSYGETRATADQCGREIDEEAGKITVRLSYSPVITGAKRRKSVSASRSSARCYALFVVVGVVRNGDPAGAV